MTIVNTYYLARLVEKGEAENLRLLWANQYDRGVHVNISGAGLIKWSKNQTSAIKLLEWASSEYAQNLYARENMEYPVVPGVDIHPILQEWGNFKEDLIQVDKLGLLQEQAVFMLSTSRLQLNFSAFSTKIFQDLINPLFINYSHAFGRDF